MPPTEPGSDPGPDPDSGASVLGTETDRNGGVAHQELIEGEDDGRLDRPPQVGPFNRATDEVADCLFPVGRLRLAGEGLMAAGVSWAWAAVAYRVWDMSPRVPLHSDRDARLITNIVRNVADEGWWTTNPNLGYPVGQQLYDFPHAGETLQLGIIRFLSLFTKSPGLLMNVYFLMGTGLVALAAYLALRHLRFGVGLSLIAGTALTWLPFRIGHGEYHLWRTSFWWVPLSVVVLLWVLHWRERFLIEPDADENKAGEKDETESWAKRLRWNLVHNLRRRRVAGAAVMIVVLGGAETMTTAFTLTLLALTGILAALRRRDPATLAIHGLAIAALAVVVGILFIPTLRFVAEHGSNEDAGRRQVTEQEAFGLKISSLVLPDPSHRIATIGRPEARIRETTPVPSEAGQTIGLIGAAGFFGAVGHSLTRGWRSRRIDDCPPWDRSSLRDDLGLLVVLGVLLATVSGLAILLSLAGLSQVRVWNRMSLIIGFCSLAYAMTWFEKGWSMVKARVESTPAGDRPWATRTVGVVLTCALVAFVIWDGANIKVDHRAADARWAADANFVTQIDDRMPDGSAVFQFPVMPFPEAGEQHRMYDYDHLRGFIHTEGDNLRWSYGAMRGRPDGDWQLIVRDELGEVESLPALIGAGFTGLWVDTYGYADAGERLRRDLRDATGVEPIGDGEGRTLFYDLRPLRQRLIDEGTSETELRDLARDQLNLDLPD